MILTIIIIHYKKVLVNTKTKQKRQAQTKKGTQTNKQKYSKTICTTRNSPQ